MDIDLEDKSNKELEDIARECYDIIEERSSLDNELIEKAKEEIRKAVKEYMASPPIDEVINIQVRVTHTPSDPLRILGGGTRELTTEIKADPKWQEWAEETLKYMFFDFYTELVYEIRQNEYMKQFPYWKQDHILNEVREEYRS